MEFERLKTLVDHLVSKELTIAFAESMTAGLASAEFGRIPGVSDVLLGGVVTYSAEVKKKLLKVNKGIIDAKGAESTETTRAMADGLETLLGPNIAVAITGVAGDVVNEYNASASTGTTFICIKIDGTYYEYRENFKKFGGRNEVRQAAVDFICECLINLTNVRFETEAEKEERGLRDILKGLTYTNQNERASFMKDFIEKKYPKE